jgi:hypothetical protein
MGAPCEKFDGEIEIKLNPRFPMNDIVSKLKTPEECAVFEKNVTERGHPDLARAARKRAIELRAQAHGATTEAERECLEAVYAYERVLSAKNRKNIKASRTWQMIKRHGILGAVERAVNRPAETSGYRALLDIGLEQYAFEAVVLRYPTLFSPEAIRHSKSRLEEHKQTDQTD